MQNISDTFGAALWALDASMEVAAMGASGINFHQVGVMYCLFNRLFNLKWGVPCARLVFDQG